MYNDMICVLKLFHGLFNLNVNELFTLSHNSTLGHALKIFKPCCTHSYAQHFFTYRVFNLWNSLPDYVVCCTTLNSLNLNCIILMYVLIVRVELLYELFRCAPSISSIQFNVCIFYV